MVAGISRREEFEDHELWLDTFMQSNSVGPDGIFAINGALG